MSGYGAKPQSARKAAAAGARSAGSYNRGKVRSRSVVSAAESHNSKKTKPMYSWVKFGEGDGSAEYASLKDNYKQHNRTSYSYKPDPKVQMTKKRKKPSRRSGGIR